MSPDLCWPEHPSTLPAWPNIRHYHVELCIITPDGDRYFIRDPSKPREDEDAIDNDDAEDAEDGSEADSNAASSDPWCPDTFNEIHEARAVGKYPICTFRALLLYTYIHPLLLAMARSVVQMPKLQDISLASSMRDLDGAGSELFFDAANHVSK